ncbi:MAG TPA: HAD family hydrolase [Steroidobacteraceae bacterium]|nr:HAD family hydrolase [Steroidobacteraceae bacterium]
MSAIRAIFFDLDDTLWDCRPVILRAEHALLDFLRERYPRVTDRHDLESMRALRVQIAREHPAMRHDFTWLRLETLRRHAREVGYPDAMADAAFEVFYRVRNEVVLYDDVRPALERLHGEYRLFAISNGNANLRAIGLDHYFEATLAARDAGTLKPDPRMFEILLQRAGLHAHDAAHVGDDPEADVEGARAAGLLPVWLNRAGSTWTRRSPAPGVEITSLDELPVALHRAQLA